MLLKHIAPLITHDIQPKVPYITELHTLYPGLHSDFAPNTANTAFQCELFSADSLSLSLTA